MTDIFDKQKRSQIMASVKNKNTKPEIVVRKLLHSMGYRFRLHKKDLPGSPDIVLPKFRKVIFIHGCFWHGHKGCSRSKLPETNREFWKNKIQRNIERDKKNIEQLSKMNWATLVIWDCEIRDIIKTKNKIEEFILAENYHNFHCK